MYDRLDCYIFNHCYHCSNFWLYGNCRCGSRDRESDIRYLLNPLDHFDHHVDCSKRTKRTWTIVNTRGRSSFPFIYFNRKGRWLIIPKTVNNQIITQITTNAFKMALIGLAIGINELINHITTPIIIKIKIIIINDIKILSFSPLL